MTFDRTPLADRHFAAVAGEAARPVDGDEAWARAGAKGVGNASMVGLATGTPPFRYGRDSEGAFLSVRHPAYVYHRVGDVRRIVLDDVLPVTTMAAAIGRTLGEVVDVPGCGDDVIDHVQEDEGGRRTMIRLRPAA